MEKGKGRLRLTWDEQQKDLHLQSDVTKNRREGLPSGQKEVQEGGVPWVDKELTQSYMESVARQKRWTYQELWVVKVDFTELSKLVHGV